MLMSLYAGVSGLKSQQTKLNVIANNISNVNTTGYKQQTVSFADLLSQTISAASRPTTTTGGTNPKQIGLGTSVAAISTNMSTGSTQYTGISTDVAISGEGFFIVQGGSDGEYQFTRAGNFEYDVDGNLTVNGYKVCGWQDYDEATDGTYAYNTQTDVQPINLYSDSYNGNKKVMAAKATGEADITATLDSTATAKGSDLHDIGAVPAEADATGTLTVYDAQGNKTEVTLKYYKCATGTDSSGDAVTSWYWTATTADGSTLGGTTSGYLLFDADGNVVTTDADYDPTVDLTVQSVAGGTSAVNVSLDMSPASTSAGSSGDGSQSGVSIKSDGYSSGTLSGISIGSDGVITGTYDNGESKPLGMIALAVFNNPAGLEKIGDNLYVTTTNSGDFQGGVAVGRGGTSALSTGVLEMSNVDLAQEFSDMMITQRAYQANSKVISTSDDMLEVLMNMIR